MGEVIKSGDTIKVHYTGHIKDGDIFDSSEGSEALKFTVGAGQLIEGFESAVIGMETGGKKTVTISPEKGYGLHQKEKVLELQKDIIPDGMVIETGMRVELMDETGKPVPAIIQQISDNTLTADLNHPLAGKKLVFTIEVVETGLIPDPTQTGCGCGKSGSGGCGCSH